MDQFVYRRFLLAILLALTGLWLLAGCNFQENVVAQEEFKRPTLVPAEALTPAPTPADRREVAILSLLIKANEEGKVEAVELQKGSIVTSFAPNVLGLSGPWTVELVGKDTIQFGTLNPLHVRVYDGEQDTPHTSLLVTETTWELVVPLYDRGQDLEVTQINIYDESRRQVFSTPVDRERWSNK